MILGEGRRRNQVEEVSNFPQIKDSFSSFANMLRKGGHTFSKYFI